MESVCARNFREYSETLCLLSDNTRQLPSWEKRRSRWQAKGACTPSIHTHARIHTLPRITLYGVSSPLRLCVISQCELARWAKCTRTWQQWSARALTALFLLAPCHVSLHTQRGPEAPVNHTHTFNLNLLPRQANGNFSTRHTVWPLPWYTVPIHLKPLQLIFTVS